VKGTYASSDALAFFFFTSPFPLELRPFSRGDEKDFPPNVGVSPLFLRVPITFHLLSLCWALPPRSFFFPIYILGGERFRADGMGSWRIPPSLDAGGLAPLAFFQFSLFHCEWVKFLAVEDLSLDGASPGPDFLLLPTPHCDIGGSSPPPPLRLDQDPSWIHEGGIGELDKGTLSILREQDFAVRTSFF